MIDPQSNLFIPQARVGIKGPKANGIGHITYRCHTCGESIVKPYEVFFVDPEPKTAWASHIVPPITPTTTTHHDWHLASED